MNIPKREDIEYQLKQTCYKMFRLDYGIESYEKTVKLLEQVFENCSKGEIEKLLKGEFRFGNSMARETGVPFYLYMEILAEVADRQFKTSENKERVVSLIEKLKDFGETTMDLDYSSRFDPKKHLTSGVVDDIIKSRGNIIIGSTEIGGKSVASITCIEVIEDLIEKDGEYLPRGPVVTKYHEHPCLYEEDTKIYDEMVEKQNQEVREKFSRVTKKYFKDGKFPPNIYELEGNLVDKNIHYNIRMILEKLVREKQDKPFSKADDELAWMKKNECFMDGIQQIEEMERAEREKKEVARKQQEAKEKAERDAAIKAAEARKLAQPGLKRWFEKMLGRDKIDYNQMSTTEIHSLWQTEKRGKK